MGPLLFCESNKLTTGNFDASITANVTNNTNPTRLKIRLFIISKTFPSDPLGKNKLNYRPVHLLVMPSDIKPSLVVPVC